MGAPVRRAASALAAAVLSACGAQDTTPGDSRAIAGSGGAAAADCAHIDFASYTASAPVSFRDDILPLFGFACTLSACHGVNHPQAGLMLGYRCTPDPTAKWACRFPTMPTFLVGSTTDIDVTMAQPQDEAMTARVRASLLAPSTTVNGATTPRVVPSHPESSFLVSKLADRQTSQGNACTNQAPQYDSPEPGSTQVPACGNFMPLNGDRWCEGKARPRFDAVAAWVAQGAP